MGTFPQLEIGRSDGDAPSPQTLYQRGVVRWCNDAYEEAMYDQDQSEELKKVGEYIDYLSGKQWTNSANRPYFKARPVSNRITPIFWELIGQLTDIKPVIEVKATAKDQKSLKQQEVLNGGLKAWWLDQDVDMMLALTIIFAFLTTGYAKFQWDPEANYGQGETVMLPLGPNAVLPLKARHTLDSGQAVIYQDPMPLALIRKKYGAAAAGVVPDPRYSRYSIEAEAPANVAPSVFKLMNPGLRQKIAGDPKVIESVFPMALVREFWVKDYTTNVSNSTIVMAGDTPWSYKVAPGKPLYPRGRLMVLGGTGNSSQILHDGPNPYFHGLFPFTMLRLNVVPWQFHGMSDLRVQIPLQDIINQILAGVIDMIKKATNPSFYAPKNAFSESVWQNLDFSKPGERAAYSATASHEPKFVAAPTLPAYVIQAMGMIKQDLVQSSGIAALDELSKKKQVPGGDSIDQFLQAKQTPVRLKGRNIEIFLRDGGKRQIANMIQFWDKEKRVTMLGSKGVTFEDMDWRPDEMMPAEFKENPEKHLSKFQFIIQPGSLLNLKRFEEAIQVFNLRKMRDIDRRTMYKVLDVNLDVDTIEKNLKEEAQQGMPMVPPGKGAGGGKKKAGVPGLQ